MSTIRIGHLYPAGTELFQDAESYLNELTTEETDIGGGGRQVIFISVVTRTVGVNSQASLSIGISVNSVSVASLARSLFGP